MKTPLLIFCFITGFALYGESSLSFDYGVSYPDGILSGIELNTHNFDSFFDFNYREKSFDINGFYFISDYISLGSVSYSGLLRDLNQENFHYFSFENRTEPFINKEGKPGNNIGVIFEVPEIQIGSSFFRNDHLSQLLFWKNFDMSNECFIGLSQTVTFAESLKENESWYLAETLLRSPFQFNSLVTFILGNEDLFSGGQFHINTSLLDPLGYSFLLMTGFSFRNVYFQHELRFSSPYSVTSDLELAENTLLFKGKIDFLNLSVSLDNSYQFFLKKKIFPWENRLWEFKSEHEIEYEYNRWLFKGAVDIILFNSETDQFETAVNLAGSVKNQINKFYWEIEGEAGYDTIFIYSLSLGGGYESSRINIDLSSDLEISNRILLELSLKCKTALGQADIITDFILEDIGLYNSGKIQMKPYFFIGLEFNEITIPEKK